MKVDEAYKITQEAIPFVRQWQEAENKKTFTENIITVYDNIQEAAENGKLYCVLKTILMLCGVKEQLEEDGFFVSDNRGDMTEISWDINSIQELKAADKNESEHRKMVLDMRKKLLFL